MNSSNQNKPPGAKYWCDFCKKFITDNKPSRLHHENSFNHKNNVKKKLKSMAIERAEAKKNEERMKSELRRLENIAMKKGRSDMNYFKDDTSFQHHQIKFNKPKQQQSKDDDIIDQSKLKDLSYDKPSKDKDDQILLKDDSSSIGKWETVSKDDEMYHLYYYNNEIEEEEETLTSKTKRKHQNVDFEKEDLISDLEEDIDSFQHNKEKVSIKYKKINDDDDDNNNNNNEEIKVEFKKNTSNKKKSLRKKG